MRIRNGAEFLDSPLIAICPHISIADAGVVPEQDSGEYSEVVMLVCYQCQRRYVLEVQVN